MDKNKEIRVRFAPSPTGYLHIGSARTAYFNWLFARKTDGRLILRIEDTDIKRHQEDTIEKVYDSLRWLGIDWDEGPDKPGEYGPYRQSERQDIYKKYTRRLLTESRAYRCFCSAEKLERRRKEALDKKVFERHDEECLGLSKSDIAKKIENGEQYSLRFLSPDSTNISFTDNVYGKIIVSTNDIDDFIILRPNGLPVYNLSNVIDDSLMGITHVIRGEDHLSNTPKQILLYEALGLKVPDFTHLPMILNKDGNKLSKRHDSVSVESYREEGFLPDAICNYLSLLGWSMGGKETIFNKEETIKKFELRSINKKPARFDHEKLLWINGNYIRESKNKDIKDLLSQKLKKEIYKNNIKTLPYLSGNIDEKMELITEIIKIKIKTINEGYDLIKPFFIDIEYSDYYRDYYKNKKLDAPGILNRVIEELFAINENDYKRKKIEECLRNISDCMDLSFRKIAEPVRFAIWGDKVSPPLFESLEILGKSISIQRIKKYKDLIS